MGVEVGHQTMTDLQELTKNLNMLCHIFFYLIFVTQGVKSEACLLGTYGDICDKNCSRNCAPSPSDGTVHCHKQSGRCSGGCNKGWHGDQCNFRCSRNCFNDVCDRQRGTCMGCKANYSGDYCETCEGSCQKKCEKRTVQQNASAPVGAILASVFVVVIVILIIIIILIVYARRRGFVWLHLKGELGSDDQNQKLLPGGEVNCVKNQDTDLIESCKQGNLQGVRTILEHNKDDIDKPGKGGLTPVMWAARRGHRELVDLLVKEGADAKRVDDVGNNILHWACYGEHVPMVKHVVSKDMVDINCRGRDGRTPLMCAARRGNKSMFDLLVSKGGLTLQVDTDGNNILHLACWGGNVKIVDYIISSDAVDINVKGQSGRTPLMAAAYRGHGEIFDFLVTKGADYTVVDDVEDNVLHVACLGGHVDIVRSVLQLNGMDVNRCGQCSRTPLMMAARNGDADMFALLMELKPDVTPDDDNNTILHLAAMGGNLRIVECVLEKMKVDINARNKRYETAAMHAARGSDVSNMLVARGGFTV